MTARGHAGTQMGACSSTLARRRGARAARLLVKPSGLRRRVPVPDRVRSSAAALWKPFSGS
eukprot:13183537-Alexandrium_andersonii.AAC.1